MFAARLPTNEVLVVGLELIGAICLLGLVVWLIRRWSLSNVRSTKIDDWSLQHLREMKAEGQITEKEFEVLKAKMLEATRLSMRQNDDSRSLDDGTIHG